MADKEQIAVRHATPKETAQMLVNKYDELAGPDGGHDYSHPNHEKWAELARLAAKMADFIEANMID